MAYGLQVYNTNGNVLINTEDQTQMQVKSTFTLSANSSFSRAGDFIAFNRTSAGSTKLSHDFNQSGSVTLNCVRIRPVDEDTPPASGSHGIKIFDAGADYVRLTTQTTRHANNLSEIKLNAMLMPRGLSSTCHPGGNQIDGLPPVGNRSFHIL